MSLSEVPTLLCQSPGFPLFCQRTLGNSGYLHSPEMGSSSNASPWWVGVPSVPLSAVYAAPAWPLVALDAIHPVADDTPLVSDGTLLALDGTLLALDGTLLALDGTLLSAVGALPLIAAVLPLVADFVPLVDPVLDVHRPGVARTVPLGRLADLTRWSYSSFLG